MSWAAAGQLGQDRPVLAVELQGLAVQGQGERQRTLVGQALPGQARHPRPARLGLLDDDLYLRRRPRQIDPLLGPRHLPVPQAETTRDEVVGQQVHAEVDFGTPRRLLEPRHRLAVQEQLDRYHSGPRRQGDRSRSGSQTQEQGEEGDFHRRSVRPF